MLHKKVIKNKWQKMKRLLTNRLVRCKKIMMVWWTCHKDHHKKLFSSCNCKAIFPANKICWHNLTAIHSVFAISSKPHFDHLFKEQIFKEQIQRVIWTVIPKFLNYHQIPTLSVPLLVCRWAVVNFCQRYSLDPSTLLKPLISQCSWHVDRQICRT